MSEPFYRWQGSDLILRCHIQPGAKHSVFCGLHDNRLKVRIGAPPLEGKANTALIGFIAKQFAVTKNAVAITAGEQSRQKTLKIAAPSRVPDDLGIQRPVP